MSQSRAVNACLERKRGGEPRREGREGRKRKGRGKEEKVMTVNEEHTISRYKKFDLKSYLIHD